MAANDDLDQLEPQEQDLEDEELEADPDDPELLVAADEDMTADEDTDSSDENLDEILTARPSPRRGREEPEEEEDIISALVPDPDLVAVEPLPSVVVPIKDQQEFVCSNCHLVKARSQLADAERGLCRDCV
ncbi:MAG TPA: DUF4193 family protein [Actinomycetota bacterium]|nr:DUF4193 family protein [Actinomycetota bacterium]